MRSHFDCRRPRGDAAGERVRPAAPDPRPHATLLGARALDGERAFDNNHHLVGRWRNVPHWTLFLFLWLLVAPLILYLVAALLFPTNQDDVVVTSWREHYYANNQKIFALFGLTFAIDLVDTLLKGLTYFLSAGSALLRVDVAAHHSLLNRRNNKITAVSCGLRRLLSSLQPGNAWEQSAAADVVAIWLR